MKKYIYILLVLCIKQTVMAQVVYPPAGQSTYIINSGQTISVTDGQSIIFGPGTHIKSGATFTASITSSADDPYQSIALSSNENYVFTRTYQAEMSSFITSSAKEGDVYESITYFDGLGRPMQQLAIKSSPDKEDIITHMEYDTYGRMEKDWLPYHEPTGSLGAYRGNRASATQSYYKTNYAADFTSLSASNTNAYAQKEYEPSPLNRVLKQAAPGQDWRLGQGHEIEMGYLANAANEVRFFEVTTTFANNTYTPSLQQNGYYTAGELLKTITKDENYSSGTNHTTEEFTNKRGQVVLKRTHNNGDHDTYYVYDNFGNLTYVIPPKVTTSSVSSTELNELCYQYKYDHRNRLVEKKIPGKDWEFIVYNKLDQPVMTQDANLGAENQWLFTKYDPFGRVAYTGKINNSSSRITLQTYANNTTTYDQFEERLGSSTLGGTTVYYTNNTIPQSLSETLTINYYDNYVDTDGLSVPSTVYGQAKATNTQGLPTVSKVRVLGTDDWITTITGYDAKGRTIYIASKNDYLGTTDVTEMKLDFAGKVLETKTTHTKDANAPIVTLESITYDHQGRLLSQKQSINGQSQETLVDNTYDDLGQLVQKEVGGGLQTVDYDYNVRGWLKSINNTASLGSDLFAFNINYNTADHSGTELYNGNISETEWRTANDNSLRWYRYGYDALNRIENAIGNSSNYNLVNVDYDKNGNIIALNRRGQTNSSATSFGTMDNLVYTYDNGNKLTNVADNNASDAYGFKDVNGSGIEYTYDDNGNMISDGNKGINRIWYNHLNFPTSIGFSQQLAGISYVYDATGNKLEKKVEGAGIATTTTEYAGNYIYENGSLQFFNHAEGYVSADNNGYKYVYQYKDHLGNVRLSYADTNNDGSIDSSTEIISEKNYYPFGLEHKGYNNVVNGTENNYKHYQGQEFTEDLGFNVHEWKFRISDPAIGRFLQVDPLAEEYNWQSVYSFASNQPIHANELEGLENEDDKSGMARFGTQPANGIPGIGMSFAMLPDSPEKRQAASTMLDFVPLVGDVKGFGEGVVGIDATGNTLSADARKLSLIGLSELKHMDEAIDAGSAAFKAMSDGADAGKVSLDNNALIGAIEGNQKSDVLKAIDGKKPIVSMQAAKEFMAKGDKNALRSFMKETGAKISKLGSSSAQVMALRKQAGNTGRNLKLADAQVAQDAINNNATLITNDKKLRNLMKALGNSSTGF